MKSLQSKNWILAAGLLLAAVRPASAHFLWAEVKDPATAGAAPTVRLTFGEAAGEDTSENLISRLATAKVRGLDKGGVQTTLAGGTSVALGAGQKVVSVEQMYGVLDKTEEKRGIFRLNYYAKAATSVADSASDTGLPMEITLARSGTQLVGTVLFNGKAAVASPVKLHLPGVEKPVDLTSDEKGQVKFSVPSAGLYGLRAAVVENVAGEIDGKKYPMVRNYTTLSFRVATTEVTAPLVQTTASAAMPPAGAKADPAAYALLRGASSRRQTFPADFKGFTSDVIFTENGAAFKGTIVFSLTEKPVLKMEGMTKEQSDWINHQLPSVINHRRSVDFDTKGNGRFPITFGMGSTAQGQLIELNDGQGSQFRVKNKQVFEITRKMPGSLFVIAIQNNVPVGDDRYLPGDYVVSYRNPETKILQRVDGFHDTYEQVGNAWLPKLRTVITFAAADNTPITRTIELRNSKLTK